MQDLVLQAVLRLQYQLPTLETVQVILMYSGQLITRHGQLYKMEMLFPLEQLKHTQFHQHKLTVQLFIFKYDLELLIHPLDLILLRHLEP